MKSKRLLTVITAASLLAAVPSFAQTTTGAGISQEQYDTLVKRIDQLEKELAEKNTTPATTVVATTTSAPATSTVTTTVEQPATQAQVTDLGKRVDKLEKPTAIKIGALTIKPYGWIKLDGYYDSQKAVPTSGGGSSTYGGYTLYTAAKANGKNDSTFDFSARDSRFGLDFALPKENDITVTAKVENDFFVNGGDTAYSVRLRLAYTDLAFGDGWSVRAGQDWDAFYYVAPITVDAGFLGDSGFLYSRRPQLKLTKSTDLSDSTKIVAKVAVTRTAAGDTDNLGLDDGIDSGKPTVEGNVALETKLLSNKATKISIGGQAGTETLDSAKVNDFKNYNSSLIVGGVFFPLVDQFAVQGNVWSGTNVDGWLGGIGQGINTKLGRSIGAQGGWLQAVYNPTDVLNLNAGYGIDDPKDDDLSAGGRTENTRLFFNAFYKLTKSVTLATEFSVIKTEYKAAASATDNRIQFTVKYAF
jgi:hypothetical protein